jgi:hypothetical protein
MKNVRFRGVNRRLAGAAAVSVGFLVPLAVFGAPALARTASAGKESPSSSQYQYQARVTVCHLTGSKKHPAVTITVAPTAVAAVLKGGGHLGPCTGTETPKAKGGASGSPNGAATGQNSGPQESSVGHGNSGNHGNGGGHENNGHDK